MTQLPLLLFTVNRIELKTQDKTYQAVAHRYSGHLGKTPEDLFRVLQTDGPECGGEVWVTTSTYKMLVTAGFSEHTIAYG